MQMENVPDAKISVDNSKCVYMSVYEKNEKNPTGPLQDDEIRKLPNVEKKEDENNIICIRDS